MKKFLMVVLGVVLVTGLSGIFGIGAVMGAGTPANFENSGIYGGQALSFAIDPNDPDVLYVGMASGYGVYKSTDAGASWSGCSAFNTEGEVEVRALAVAPSDSNIVFASDSETLKKSTDGGVTWSTLSNYTGENIYSIAIHPTNPLIVYLGTGSDQADTPDDAIVWKTENGGDTWASLGVLEDGTVSGDTLVGKVTIDPNNSETIYAVTGSILSSLKGNIFKSTNGGDTWLDMYPVNTDFFEDICVDPTNSNIIFAAGNANIVKSIDGGVNWSSVLPSTQNGFSSVVIDKNDSNIVYAGEGRGKSISKSTTGGGLDSWAGIYSAGVDIKLFTDPVTTGTIYAIDSVGVMKSTDSGTGWTAVNNNIDAVEVISSAADPDNSDVMYVGTESGYISKTTDKGSTWSVVHKELYGIPALAIDPNNTQIVYAADRGTAILKSTDGGANWVDMMTDIAEYEAAFSTSVNPRRMMVDPITPTTVYICQAGYGEGATVGNLHKSTDSGDIWDTGLLPANNPVLSMAMPSDSNTIYVGRNDQGDATYRGVVKTTDGGINWASVGLTDEIIWVLVMDPNNEDVLYAGIEDPVAEGSKVYKTINAGVDWTDITPSGTVHDIYETIAIDPSDSNIVYAGNGDGSLYKSTDAGSSWTLLSDAFVSVKTLMIGSLYAGTGGGLYKYSPDTTSTSGGSSGGCFIDTVR